MAVVTIGVEHVSAFPPGIWFSGSAVSIDSLRRLDIGAFRLYVGVRGDSGTCCSLFVVDSFTMLADTLPNALCIGPFPPPVPLPPHIVTLHGFHPIPLGDSLRLSANIEHWDPSEVRYLRSSCGWLRFRATTVAPGFYYVWAISDRDTTHVGCCDLYFADSLGQADTADSQVCVVRGTGIATAPSPPRTPHVAHSPPIAQGGAPGGRALPIREGSVRELALWPNPASGVVTVEGLRADAIVRVYSLDGRPQRGVRRLGASTLDLRALPDGVYAIRAGTAVGHVTVLH